MFENMLYFEVKGFYIICPALFQNFVSIESKQRGIVDSAVKRENIALDTA